MPPTIASFLGMDQTDAPTRVILAPPSIIPVTDRTPAERDVDEFQHGGAWYVRCSHLTQRPASHKKRTSPQWAWGEDIKKRGGLTKDRFFWCYLCEKKGWRQELPIVSTGNSTALDHLCKKHNMDRRTGELRSARPASQPTYEEYPDRKAIEFRRIFKDFKQILIRWIVCCHIAFFQLENEYFRELLFFLEPKLQKLLPKACRVIRQWVLEEYEHRKALLIEELESALSQIAISFDLWTSPSQRAILGVTAHFINKDCKRRHVLLGLRELFGEHSGKNQAVLLLQIIREYKIQGRISYFMADNADNCDTAIDAVLRALYPKMSAKLRKRRRLRCFGHICNLCAQAFIIGDDAEKISKEIDAATRDMNFRRVQELWKKRGAIGLLQNLARYIRFSPQRRNFFMGIRMGGDLAKYDKLMVSAEVLIERN